MLTGRQHQIVDLVARGHTNAQIAALLSIQKGTVKNHLSAVYRVLGLYSRYQIIVWAFQNDILLPADVDLERRDDEG